jgi:dihydrofolate synthase / folylpolyglutamate synthase
VPGRLEVVDERPMTIFDAAHNPSGAAALAESLPDLVGERRPRTLVMSVLEDKDAAGMLSELLPLFDRAVYTRCENPRSLSPATLDTLAAKLGGPPSETVADPRRALERSRSLAGPGGAVVATGSIYLVADLVRAEGQARASTL